jgi:hypothetical protein
MLHGAFSALGQSNELTNVLQHSLGDMIEDKLIRSLSGSDPQNTNCSHQLREQDATLCILMALVYLFFYMLVQFPCVPHW